MNQIEIKVVLQKIGKVRILMCILPGILSIADHVPHNSVPGGTIPKSYSDHTFVFSLPQEAGEKL